MRRWCIAIFVAVFSLYLLSSGREPPSGDSHPMWDVADALVQHGKIDISTRWPENIPPGRDGKTYGIAPIGPVLAQVPGAAIHGIVHGVAPSYTPLVKPLAAHVGPAALGALA